MAKFEVVGSDAREAIQQLKIFRSGWANDIREGWTCSLAGAKELTYELYEIAGTIILAIENRLNSDGGDKMALHMTKAKLEKLIKSEAFDEFSAMSEAGMCKVITTGTRQHIRVMFEAIEVLLA